jgi:hypothetical protein
MNSCRKKGGLKLDGFKIMVIKVNYRVQKATEMQSILTKFGCNIKVRLGLHEAGDACSNQGLIILQVAGDDGTIATFEKELCSLEGVSAKLVEI